MRVFDYNRQNAVEYAKKWALKRNPKYYNFDNIGGDCTSFASQCLFAG
ncbi:MAG: amidase domain-containing protein, partial [Clostridia bacterium]|nr:amidase domain-containing protein [Clostridia bacterium]